MLLFLVTPFLAIAVQPCMEWIPMVANNSEHNKAKGLNRNVNATISHNEYKDVLLNNKYLNRIQSKDHRIGIYEINKILLSCFDDKIIQNNGYDMTN